MLVYAGLTALVIVGGFAAFTAAQGELGALGDTSCQDAAIEHFRQAQEGPDAEWHFWAGVSAQELQKAGESCPEVLHEGS